MFYRLSLSYPMVKKKHMKQAVRWLWFYKLFVVLAFYSSAALSMMSPEEESEGRDYCIDRNGVMVNIHSQISDKLILGEEAFKIMLPCIYTEMLKTEKKTCALSKYEERNIALNKDNFKSLQAAWDFMSEKNPTGKLNTQKLHQLYLDFIQWRGPDECGAGVFSLFQQNGGNYHSRFYSSIIWCYYLSSAWIKAIQATSRVETEKQRIVKKAFNNFSGIVSLFENGLKGCNPDYTIFINSKGKVNFLTLPEILFTINPVSNYPVFQPLNWNSDKKRIILKNLLITSFFSALDHNSTESDKLKNEIMKDKPDYLNLFFFNHDDQIKSYECMKLAAKDNPILGSSHLLYNYPIASWSDKIKHLDKRLAEKNNRELTVHDPVPQQFLERMAVMLSKEPRVLENIRSFMHTYGCPAEEREKLIAKANGNLYYTGIAFFQWIEDNEGKGISFIKAAETSQSINRTDIIREIKEKYSHVFARQSGASHE